MSDAALPGPLRLGDLTVDVPVVLAPMAGVTNAAFRQLCAEQGALRGSQARTSGQALRGSQARTSGQALRGSQARTSGQALRGSQARTSGQAGLYVCEMITSRGVVEGDRTSLGMLTFAPNERVRSVQLYGIDPATVGRAVAILCGDHGVDHVDLNFGCPVPKVTRKGGGAALPWKATLLGRILTEAVAAAAPFGVPVTMKTRKGIDDDHLTYLDAGHIAEDSGCAAIALHGRTAVQHYSGEADWAAIAALKAAVSIPVLGNGDVWEAADALRMVRETGCDGVVVGRGCLGRPWLFRDLAAAFTGEETVPALPTLGEVMAIMRRHAELLGGWLGEERGCVEFRKHVAWYLKGFPAGPSVRQRLGQVSSYAALDELLVELDPTEAFPVTELGRPRGRQGTPKRVVLPDGWLDDREFTGALDPAAEDATSGG
nr:tRNA dihydrouridine synthase DusB [Aeromicrobium marinum]